MFGGTRGVAPGLDLSLDWRKFSFYSESECVIDSEDKDDNFLYTWSEFTYAPVDWFHFGFVGQRTRLYDSSLDIDRGLIVGLSWKDVDFTVCVFNLGWEEPTVVLGVSVEF